MFVFVMYRLSFLSHFTGNSRSKTDVEANIDLKARLLSKEKEIETQHTEQRSMATPLDCIEMSDKDQTPNTPDCMDKTVLSQTLLNEQLPSSLMTSEQPTAEANESGRKPCFIENDAGFIIYCALFFLLCCFDLYK